jgi:hypothetical protein
MDALVNGDTLPMWFVMLWIAFMAFLVFSIFVLPFILLSKYSKKAKASLITLTATVVGHERPRQGKVSTMNPIVRYYHNGEWHERRALTIGLQKDWLRFYPIGSSVLITVPPKLTTFQEIWVKR